MSRKKQRNLHKQAVTKPPYDVKPITSRKILFTIMALMSVLVGIWMAFSANLLSKDTGGFWFNYITRVVIGAVLVGFGLFWYTHVAFDWVHVDNQNIVIHRIFKKSYSTTFKQLNGVVSMDSKTTSVRKMPKEIEIMYGPKDESIVVHLQKSTNGDKLYQDIRTKGIVIKNPK